MQTQELEWNKGMVAQYGVDVVVPEHARLEIPLYHAREVVSRPGGLAIRQLPEFIQFQYDAIRQEQAQEMEHFSVEEQNVFGSHLVPRLHLEFLLADTYQALADIIHNIDKPYCEWSLNDYLMFTDTVQAMALDGGNCEVQRRASPLVVQRACLIYDAKNALRVVGLIDTKEALVALEPNVFFGLVQSLEGVPLHSEAHFVKHFTAA